MSMNTRQASFEDEKSIVSRKYSKDSNGRKKSDVKEQEENERKEICVNVVKDHYMNSCIDNKLFAELNELSNTIESVQYITSGEIDVKSNHRFKGFTIQNPSIVSADFDDDLYCAKAVDPSKAS
uniref:Uncharacterized protein n=1 Tax=Euplotes harpa TaxID=151035 RepID=A0A7S3JHZ0_9SPIT|mmetsp:Transcript_37849/g.43494  ORF Transcript_37849/g.43494 Transcript_37849/m.43494 type:complete len:124 (+) Transcript_37849:55-426(+)